MSELNWLCEQAKRADGVSRVNGKLTLRITEKYSDGFGGWKYVETYYPIPRPADIQGENFIVFNYRKLYKMLEEAVDKAEEIKLLE